MTTQPLSDQFDSALEDLRRRTLARLQGDFARLIYLASTRNYNTGRYEHDGLTFRYSGPVAERALAAAHGEVFLSLALGSLEILTRELERYVVSESVFPAEVLAVWNDLEAYRILVPLRHDPLIVQVFRSNLRAALAIVGESWKQGPPRPDQQCASRLPLPGQ